MNEWLQRPVTELIAGMAAGKFSAEELMRATLARIDQTQPSLNCFTSLRAEDAVLDEARAADARIARGEARALEGVPLGVKDLEDAEGMVTSLGSVPFKDNMAHRDSLQTERLRAAGAIVVGKTNTPEFGYTAISKNLLFGESRNPWDLDRTPGGSSGGSSAGIAGGVVPMATASDGGGYVPRLLSPTSSCQPVAGGAWLGPVAFQTPLPSGPSIHHIPSALFQ